MRKPPNAVMVFAAGRGTRMAPLTDHMPKPLIRVAGKALIDHALSLVPSDHKVVVNTHHFADQMADHLRDAPVTINHEPKLLDTGGGLRDAMPIISADSVFTLNSDAVWIGANPLDVLREAWDPAKMDAILCLIQPKLAVGHSGSGDFLCAQNGQLRRGPGLIYGGAQILNPGGLNDIELDVFSLNLLWDQFVARGRLFGIVYPGQWCDVGRPENIAKAEAALNV